MVYNSQFECADCGAFDIHVSDQHPLCSMCYTSLRAGNAEKENQES